MSALALTLTGVAKSFNRRLIFSDITFTLCRSDSLTVTGKNGSGKSTLLKIIAGLLGPSKGKVEMSGEDGPIPPLNHYRALGFVSPYLQLYDEFTALENLQLIQRIRAVPSSARELRDLLDRLGLEHRADDLLRTYSSGMKQRVKFAAAVAHHPAILLLDEPGSNLDDEGKAIVRELIAEQRTTGIVVIATNEAEEIALCDQVLHIGSGAPRPVRTRP